MNTPMSLISLTGMHMHAGNSHFGGFYNALDVPDLVYGDPKFAVYVPGRDLEITTGHDMGVEPDANRIAAAKLVAKLL